MVFCKCSVEDISCMGKFKVGDRGVVPLMWMYFWAVQNIPCRTKGCKSTALAPEAATVTSRPLAKPNQRAKVLHCCYDTDLTDVPTAWCEHNSWRGIPSNYLVVILHIKKGIKLLFVLKIYSNFLFSVLQKIAWTNMYNCRQSKE